MSYNADRLTLGDAIVSFYISSYGKLRARTRRRIKELERLERLAILQAELRYERGLLIDLLDRLTLYGARYELICYLRKAGDARSTHVHSRQTA